MSELIITERQEEDVIFLILHGDLVFGKANQKLRDLIRHLLNEGQRKIYLDMKSVGYVDSGGIGELISGFTAINRKNGEFRLLNLPPRIRELLKICKFLTIFDTEL
ncbi:MAG: STAS domain-containing protein [Acidobacteriota bacterium]